MNAGFPRAGSPDEEEWLWEPRIEAVTQALSEEELTIPVSQAVNTAWHLQALNDTGICKALRTLEVQAVIVRAWSLAPDTGSGRWKVLTKGKDGSTSRYQ